MAEQEPPQDDIIETIIDGGDALVLMPTGGGKSLCYQIPSLARSGCGAGEKGNKGREAVEAALEMIDLYRQIEGG